MGIRVLFVVKDLEGAEPLGLLSVAAGLEQAGHDCRVIGTRGNDVLGDVRRFAPQVVACGSTTGLHRYYLGLLARIKAERPACLTLLGGPHPTELPAVIQSPALDVVCRGEGEGAAVDLCDALAAGRPYHRIADLWVVHEGAIHPNGPRPLVEHLDGLPFAARHLVYRYDPTLRSRKLKSFTANRGCPYRCHYCFNPSLAAHYGPSWHRVRVRSPENLVAEIALVRASGPLEVIGFRESIFVHDLAWLERFADLYRREIALPYYAHLRADALDEPVVALLAESGCVAANVGVETASERLLREVLGRPVDRSRLRRGISLLRRAGIVVFADNMVGIPGGSFEDDLATLDLNVELGVDYAAATLCTPYPGTELARRAIELGLFDGDFDRIDESYYTGSILDFPTPLARRRAENLQKLFALTVALPPLRPLVRRLVALPPNDFFYAAFRAFYVLSHLTEVMPRRLTARQLVDALLGIFGVYRGADPHRFRVPATRELPYASDGAAVRGPRPRERPA